MCVPEQALSTIMPLLGTTHYIMPPCAPSRLTVRHVSLPHFAENLCALFWLGRIIDGCQAVASVWRELDVG